MEELIFRYPHLAEKIFQDVDPKSFAKCRLVSKKWEDFMKEEKFYFFKMVKAITNCSSESLKMIYKNSSLKSVIKLALDVNQIYGKCKEKGKTNPYYEEILYCGRNWTAFHKASEDGHFSICQLIIENSENKNPTDIYGLTPLHLAAENGHLSICELIINNVSDKNPECTKDRKTPLHIAAKSGHLLMCQLMIENSQDKNPKDRIGMTPLHWAAQHGYLEVCKLIMGKVRNKNPSDNVGFTPLHRAAMNGHFSTCKYFIENIDDISPGNILGITPQDLAQKFGHRQVVQLFESAIAVLTYLSHQIGQQ